MLQRSSKSQTPKRKTRCRGKRRAGRFLSLELGASLELGVWNLELVAGALSFSKIEMCPHRPCTPQLIGHTHSNSCPRRDYVLNAHWNRQPDSRLWTTLLNASLTSSILRSIASTT